MPAPEIVDLPLAGLKLIKPAILGDDRGFFIESYRKDLLKGAGVDVDFVQDNHSRSTKGTVRGLHFQRPNAQGPGQAKLVQAVNGKIFDVAVDVRSNSPTFGKWYGVELDDVSRHQLYVPVGFAHGFCVVSDVADVLYKVSSFYDPQAETGFAFDDPSVGVKWPVTREAAILSKRDMNAGSFAEVIGAGDR